MLMMLTFLLVLYLNSGLPLPMQGVVAADPCTSPANSIVAENCQVGNPASEWDISGDGDASIQGFTNDISYNRGDTVSFKVKTNATSYSLNIYRLGYYGGAGARKVATIQPSVTLPQNQPNCLTDASSGLIDCGNWAVSASWTIPTNATSGVYLAKLVRPDTGGASHSVFIVRDDASTSDLLFQTSDTTWHAYNTYGGNNLYLGGPGTNPARAYKVSYNRPFNTRVYDGATDWIFNAEYPMLRWLEANGYNVSYFTDVDSDRRGNLIRNHKVFLSVGHDEYWSAAQRANVEAARNAGTHLGFFSGNEIFWKTRWENSIDGSNTSYRTLVSYKETHANAVIDPQDPPTWTGSWRDPRFSPPADGGRPENALSGTIFTVNCCTYAITVPDTDGKMRFWRNTSIATLASGTTATLPSGTLGPEWDEDLDNGFRPPGLIRLSTTTQNVQQRLQDYGSTYASGTATHHLTLYRHSSGALVFGSGTYQWSWGLDSKHDNGSTAPDVRMQQATVNLFADMGVQPGNLQTGLVLATASTDTTAPTSTISSPTAGTTVQTGSSVTIIGTASDTGGVVGGVEVSVDGGTTWHPANGRANWSYTWQPSTTGSVTIKSRAADDSGNIETPGTGVTITVGARTCPCSLWDNTATPVLVADPDTQATELGVKFTSDVSGSITGLRFYKSSTNTGTHVGTLWSSSGQQLAQATFTSETASGWQQVNFANPVTITANTVYVASYHTNVGHYSQDANYFANSGLDNPPLHALRDGVSGANGVYTYSANSAFPTSTYQSANYWVDVVFSTSTSGTTSPTVTSTTPTSNATGVSTGTTVKATFSKAMDSTTINTNTFQLRGSNNTLIAASVSYDGTTNTATLTPSAALTANTTYTATIIGGTTDPRVKDQSGNALAQNYTWSFTTASTTTSCPCTIWDNSTIPGVVTDPDTAATEVGVKFRSDVNGYIKGIRFYKSSTNTGTHVGTLWSSSGQQLAQATFSSETASGWQQVNFATPVAITANTVYVASYHTNAGHYSADEGYFANSGVDKPPLHALANGVSGANGVYRYTSKPAFPNSTYNSSNYWVDVVFSQTNP